MPEGQLMFYSLTPVTRNPKLGPMPVSTSTRSTCPPSCALYKDGCYAEYGPMSIFWGRLDKGEVGMTFDDFIKHVERLPKKQLWRYGQAGDLPGVGDAIDRDQMIQLARANRRRPVIAFTHKPPTKENLDIINTAREMGFPINLSANNVNHADELLQYGFNVVVVLPDTYQRKKEETKTEFKSRVNQLPKHTPKGTRIAVCPATYTETNCLNCGVCAGSQLRGVVIGFPAHGTKRAKVSQLARQSSVLRTGPT